MVNRMPLCSKCEETRIDDKPDFTSCPNYKESKYTGCYWLQHNDYCMEYWKYNPSLIKDNE